MSIDDLTKSQLLLLTILVSFVTSIATGIITVSLLDVAPPVVTQTVNQIVDHTIETVATQVPIVSRPTPPPPSTEDLMTRAVAAASARTVGIYAGATTTPLVSTGTYLPKARAVATASSASLPHEALIQFADGSTAQASIAHAGATVTIYGFSDTAALPDVPAPSLVAASTLKQGQTVIALTNDSSAVRGIVSKVDDAGIHTDLSGVPAGAAAVDLSGNVIGVSFGTGGLFANADRITTLLAATSTVGSQ